MYLFLFVLDYIQVGYEMSKANKYMYIIGPTFGLCLGYDQMGYEMSKPHLRAELEADLKAYVELIWVELLYVELIWVELLYVELIFCRAAV